MKEKVIAHILDIWSDSASAWCVVIAGFLVTLDSIIKWLNPLCSVGLAIIGYLLIKIEVVPTEEKEEEKNDPE